MIWQPSASIAMLKKRAELLKTVRFFFEEREYLEVETPCIGPHTVTDRHIQSMEVNHKEDQPLFLQTSPEYFMKRLLAAGSGSIFQIGKSFRHEEQGKLHNPEFTLLEWYRPGFTHLELMNEVSDFISHCLELPAAEQITYADLFARHLQFCPHTATLKELQQQLLDNRCVDKPEKYDKNTCLQLLMSQCIEPLLGHELPTLVYHYPASQAALAQINNNITPPIAERFELYIRGKEIANGFHELIDREEQQQRFIDDQIYRSQHNKTPIAIDEKFLSCLPELPACAGVALGFDRLLMLQQNQSDIRQTISFSWDAV